MTIKSPSIIICETMVGVTLETGAQLKLVTKDLLRLRKDTLLQLVKLLNDGRPAMMGEHVWISIEFFPVINKFI